MKVYMDTEFTGLHKNTTLISIGLVSDDNETFYAEFTDYDKSQCDSWIEENVIKNLYLGDISNDSSRVSGVHTEVRGKTEYIRKELESWLNQYDSVQLVSDVCHYDMVLFLDIFGGASNIPPNVSPYCHDINQDIARVLGISDLKAFDKSREALAVMTGFPIEGKKHNSLYDAQIIRLIYTLVGYTH